jgi:hypothetical protein
MGTGFAGIAPLWVLIGSVLIGVYIELYDANQWSAMAKRARRFSHREDPPSDGIGKRP